MKVERSGSGLMTNSSGICTEKEQNHENTSVRQRGVRMQTHTRECHTENRNAAT